jgi:myosin heavy subunit
LILRTDNTTAFWLSFSLPTKDNLISLPESMLALLRESGMALVKEIARFISPRAGSKASGRPVRSTTNTELLADFQAHLQGSRDGKVHFVHCIKSNRHGSACQFDPEYVAQQVGDVNLAACVSFRASSYDRQLSFADFAKEFAVLMRALPPQMEAAAAIQSILQRQGLPEHDAAIGSSHVRCFLLFGVIHSTHNSLASVHRCLCVTQHSRHSRHETLSR